MRKLLVLLLCALAIFAAVSCKNEPAPVAEKYVVTFDTRGGSIIDSVTLEKGAKVEKPADPILVGSYFGGWFTDAECTTAYDFDAPVTKSITLYPKFAEGTTYRVTSQSTTSSDGNTYDKFILSLKDAGVKPGDVFSLSFRTTEPITQYSIRRVGDDKKFFHEKKVSSSNVYPQFFSSMETGKDGWTTVTYVFPEEGAKTQDAAASAYPKADGNVTGIGFNVYLRNQKMVPGALLELRAIAINGVEVPIAEANMNPNKGEALSTLEVLSWTPRKVTFVTGENASAIEPIVATYGQPAVEPAKPTKTDESGLLFYGWYTDDAFTNEFSFSSLIFEDTTLYAKFVAPVTVTFDADGGTEIDPAVIPTGYAVDKPATDPTKEGHRFGGWYKDEGCTEKYDFDDAVTTDITIYAKWLDVYEVTLNYNYGKDNTKAVYVPMSTGALVADDLRAGRPGYYLDGWYTLAEGGTKVDIATYKVTADTSLFAHWTEEKDYYNIIFEEKDGTTPYKRFDLNLASSVYSPKEGDIISFKYRSKSDKVAVGCLRNSQGSGGKIIYWSGLSGYKLDTDDDTEWKTFYYVLGSKDKESGKIEYPMNGIRFELAQSRKEIVDGVEVTYDNDSPFEVGDYLDIRGFAVNGVGLGTNVLADANFPQAAAKGAKVTLVKPQAQPAQE